MVKSPDLSVELAGLTLQNPVLAASGTFGYGLEYADFVDPAALGAVVVKGLSRHPRPGNPPPRIVETTGGMLNAIGLENVGLEVFLRDKLPWLKERGATVIVNVYGESVEEYRAVAEGLDGAEGVAMLEINVSCPNVTAGGMFFGASPQATAEVVRAVRGATRLPIMVKLTPMVTDIVVIARAAVGAGAVALSLINTIPGLAVDLETRRPRLANNVGGLSGPAIKPVALRLVWQVARAVDVPVVGGGGIMTARDALEFILVGAAAVQVGTANFVNPRATLDVLDGIKQYLEKNGHPDLAALRGRLETY
ncbi:MAG: dihydroorotate dehydrogenase [Thermodesulfobacteriota bacterium]